MRSPGSGLGLVVIWTSLIYKPVATALGIQPCWIKKIWYHTKVPCYPPLLVASHIQPLLIWHCVTWEVARAEDWRRLIAFRRIIAGEPLMRRLGVRLRGGRALVLLYANTEEEEESTTSPPRAERQLCSELLNGLMQSPEDSVLSTGKMTTPTEMDHKIWLKYDSNTFFNCI